MPVGETVRQRRRLITVHLPPHCAIHLTTVGLSTDFPDQTHCTQMILIPFGARFPPCYPDHFLSNKATLSFIEKAWRYAKCSALFVSTTVATKVLSYYLT